MNARLAILFFAAVNTQVLAKSFGVVGDTYPVEEMSFLQLIEERLQTLSRDGSLDAMQEHWLNQTARMVNRPDTLALMRLSNRRTHYYRPEVVLTAPIYDSQGQILYPQGTRVNALERLPHYAPCWLFFNGDDNAQVNWAKKERCTNPKFILTGGAIKDAEDALNAAIYFDQAGRITERLGVTHVPARVTRQGNELRIDELAIKENGDVL